MPAISLPPVPYDATAVRPDWADLPVDLRSAIADRLGAPVVTARPAGGGFTRGFAAMLETATGDRAFVKAASLAGQSHLCDWYAREAQVLAALPAGLPTTRGRWTLTAAGHFVSCLDTIEGRMPSLPWRPAQLDATLASYARIGAALANPPAELVGLGLPRLADLAREDLSHWREIADHRAPMPAVPVAIRDRLADLVRLEALLPGYADSTGLIHCDLRVDNVLIDAGGTAWICDWNWLCHGPAWFDLAGLLVTGYASGLDVDARYAAHPASRDAPPDSLDAALAALSGYLLTSAMAGPSSASPHIRRHQRWSGELALAWLTERQGWR